MAELLEVLSHAPNLECLDLCDSTKHAHATTLPILLPCLHTFACRDDLSAMVLQYLMLPALEWLQLGDHLSDAGVHAILSAWRVFAGYGSSWHRRSLVYSPFGWPWRNFLLPPPRASMLSAAKVTGPPSTTNTLVLQDGKVKCDICGHLLGYGASEGTAIANLKKHQKEARRCLTAQAKLKSGLTAASTSRTPAAKFDFAGFFKHMAKVLAAPTVPRVPAAPPPSQALSLSPVASGTNSRPRASSPPPISTLNT
ncbi:hypothetical protein GGX14DRAFT_569838 [Mycena pura]|uniref:BED-type domain-containing protein n=1 Tax=Mycena pura TaxID=153505 RepID=A0AAD6V9S8_9AGAR|nr:hypothetical protein GGX14DRAFT_569838 [Mycena pura]